MAFAYDISIEIFHNFLVDGKQFLGSNYVNHTAGTLWTPSAEVKGTGRHQVALPSSSARDNQGLQLQVFCVISTTANEVSFVCDKKPAKLQHTLKCWTQVTQKHKLLQVNASSLAEEIALPNSSARDNQGLQLHVF